MISILCFFWITLFTVHADAPKSTPVIAAPQAEQSKLLQSIDQKYQKAKSISMNAEKVDKLSALDQTREFSGTIKMKKGKFRLELKTKDASQDKSLIVADGKTLWFVTPPPKEFKEAKTQVFKASMSDKRAKSQGLLQMLTEGGVLKFFKINGVTEAGSSITFFMQPKSTSMEFRRAQIVANKDDQTISSLKYWDSMDNETTYVFSQIQFNQSIDDSLLSYTPPKDADVMNY